METGKSVAVPGTSEHQLGLAVDIVDINNQHLDETYPLRARSSVLSGRENSLSATGSRGLPEADSSYLCLVWWFWGCRWPLAMWNWDPAGRRLKAQAVVFPCFGSLLSAGGLHHGIQTGRLNAG